MAMTLLFATLLLGFPAGRSLGAVSRAGQPTLGDVQQQLDDCRSEVAAIKVDLGISEAHYKQAKGGEIIEVHLPDSAGVVPVNVKDWQALLGLDLFEGEISPADYAKLQAKIKNWQASTVNDLKAEITDAVAFEQRTQQKCAALERQRNQLLGGGVLFKLVPSLTKVVNTHSTELTIDPTAGTGVLQHCCDGGAWDVTYTWKVPDTIVPGTKYQVEVSIQVNKVNPEQPLGFQISVLAPDFAQSYNIEYPHPTGGSKTFDIPVASDQSGSKEYSIQIGFESSSVTYTYQP